MTSHYFDRQLAEHPDSLALTDLASTRSWRELDRNVAALAHYLATDANLTPGDHLAMLVGNRVEYMECLLAGLLTGLWVTPVNTHLTAGEIDYIRRDCGAKLVLHDDAHAELLDASVAACNIQRELPPIVEEHAGHSVAPTAPAGGNMLYTSGTTGRPKGVKRAKPDNVEAMIARMCGFGSAFGLTGAGPHLVTGPLYHAAPGLFATYDLLNGATVIIMPRWDCATFFRAVREHRVVTTHLVPTMFVRLLEAREQGAQDIDVSSLRHVLHGAAPISRGVKQRMLDWWGPILTEYWGATESGVVTLADSGEWVSHPGTVGRPIPNFEVYVGDAQGNPVEDAEGLLFCRHRQLASVFHYHEDAEKTRRAHPQPHVLSLGDIGRVDADGFVYLSDRESNMIISGGVNIYPSEIEQALLEHADIADIAVFGIPNDEWGEEVKAVVELRPGLAGDAAIAEDIRRFGRERLAGFKVPRSVDFVERLPRNPTGKVLVRQLKAQYATG
ncbi:AMP-binding protein [Mangrovimicrobium sediminis]|uniref:AMP-binding protein n=1 Tax=Mangrovimicrobium sediminis TaxID=2562682 RepID=UPI0014369C86|nr:AMP-binding protein [Haliea sp. SAOS-164]